MNNNIKSKIESYVMEEFTVLSSMDPTIDGYYSARGSIVKEISTLVDLLQKEDINNSNSIFNNEKIKNEVTKINKEHELNIKKLECEVKKNEDNFDLDKEKIKNGYEIDNKKIENDIAKIDNDLRKINYDNEINDRKIQCDIDKLQQEVDKINKDYEINKEKIQIEVKKNEDNLHIETRKIDSAEIKNNSDAEFKNRELDMDAKRDIYSNGDRVLNVLVKLTEIGVPAVIYNVWMKRGFEFEQTGTYCSNTFKNLIGKFRPGK